MRTGGEVEMTDKEQVVCVMEDEIRLAEHWDEQSREVDVSLLKMVLALLKSQSPKRGHWKVLENCSNAGVYCSECGKKMFDFYLMMKKI